MARKNVSIPDDLLAAVAEHLPDLNVSAVVQDALRAMLEGECPHSRITCTDCGQTLNRDAVSGEALSEFWAELLHEWQPLVDKGGTAEGAARVGKNVAVRMGVPGAERRALPRPARHAREAAARW